LIKIDQREVKWVKGVEVSAALNDIYQIFMYLLYLTAIAKSAQM